MQENVVEFYSGQKTATVTFCEMRYKNRIRKLAEKYPEECQIVSEDADGGMLAHVPVEWVRIIPRRHYDRTREQQEALEKQLAYARSCRKNKH